MVSCRFSCQLRQELHIAIAPLQIDAVLYLHVVQAWKWCQLLWFSEKNEMSAASQSECRARPGKRSCSDAPVLRFDVLLQVCSFGSYTFWHCSPAAAVLLWCCTSAEIMRSDAPMFHSAPLRNPALRFSAPFRVLVNVLAPMLRCFAPVLRSDACAISSQVHMYFHIHADNTHILALLSCSCSSALMLRCSDALLLRLK